jgi:two-component system nitrate/nitrite response regulator NarL
MNMRPELLCTAPIMKRLIPPSTAPLPVSSACIPSPTIRSHRVALLVEDEPVYQDMFRQALKGLAQDWTLEVAGTGNEGLQALRQPAGSFDIVLVDLGLPDMRGVEVIRAAREQHPDTPVLVASIHSDEAHVLEAVRRGARGYLLKDDEAMGISSSIVRVMNGEYPISPSLARHLFRLAVPETPTPSAEDRLLLAPKEFELLGLLARGCSYKKAALTMEVSLSTVQTYVRRIYQKLEAHSKIEAIRKARSMGLLQ